MENLRVPVIYDDTWFKLNVIHDIERKNVRVYIYNELKFEVPGREAASHYFKCGVYGQDYSSHRMESRWKNIKGYDYSSGVWQFEAFGYVPSNTSGVVVMQIFGAETHATTLMMRVHDGALSYYRNPIYINGELKFEGSGRGGRSHFFKCGVYAQDDASDYMESRWKQIKVLKK
uniref:Alginate lyase 2 domain-containing protein n=1 Tax=Kalanchoe fedtschenkoi TaxID=63787 RepID=A0A7N0SYH5_KALFE